MSKYVRFCESLNDKGVLLAPGDVNESILEDKDYYQSVYYYNEDQYNIFKTKKSIKGIRDVYTDKLWWDFDSTDPSIAKQDAVELIRRLNKYGILDKDIEVYFSGNKGFNVLVTLDKQLNPDSVYNICVNKFGKDLKTLDSSLYDASQILRIPGTRHQKSGLFKIPLSVDTLKTESLETIKNKAVSLDDVGEFEWDVVSPNDTFYHVEESKPEKKSTYELDLSKKMAKWRNCKWSILQGNFEAKQRHEALVVLAATCRGMGYDKETTYYMCKSALKKQSARTGQEDFPKEELWTNIIENTVFKDGWEGGQYTCSKPGWLQTYCKSLGEHSCKDKEDNKPCIVLEDMGTQFIDYATNFEQNVIKTGIKRLDENVMLCSSTLNGLLGQPGAGKTSMSLNYLRHTSLNNIPSVFLSLDMGMPIVFAKLVQKKTGRSFKDVLNTFKNDKKEAAKLITSLKEEYKNVGFNFKSGLTVPDIKTVVEENNELKQQKTKLVIIDYLECLAGPYSDPTANSGWIANQLKDLANDLNVCILLLLQTQKHSTPDISDPLLSLKGVKGSSLIEQSCSTILTLWREGYNPKTVEDDKYISFAVVKNRFGSLWSDDFRWDGVTGNIRELTEEEQEDLINFKEKKLDLKREADALNGAKDSEWK